MDRESTQTAALANAAAQAAKLRALMSVDLPRPPATSLYDALHRDSDAYRGTEAPVESPRKIRRVRRAIFVGVLFALLAILAVLSTGATIRVIDPALEFTSTIGVGSITAAVTLGLWLHFLFSPALTWLEYWGSDDIRERRESSNSANLPGVVLIAILIAAVGVFFQSTYADNPMVRFGAAAGILLTLLGYFDYVFADIRKKRLTRERLNQTISVAVHSKELARTLVEIGDAHTLARHGELLIEAVTLLRYLGAFSEAELLEVSIPPNVQSARDMTHRELTALRWERGDSRGLV
ncbi:hypothetical protein AB0F44_25320 [Nocardioides sp. NPDC023903]|uniref:hypothetical protein n=1 Tax=Nocardioides sp. NPDC023903 TaxID=3157195 RepID=UPI00340111F8